MGVLDERFTPDPRPDWGRSAELDATACRWAFDAPEPFTIGVEEELMLLSPATLDLEPAIEPVLSVLGGDPRFAKELRPAQVELITPVCTTASAAADEICRARRDLIDAAAGVALVAGAGTHPVSTRWGDVTPGDRYERIAQLYPWAASRGVMCGMHVHVAAGGAERSLAVFNALRSYVPELSALAANSPFYEGADTGLCSVRPKLNEAFPRAGIPPALESWDEFVDHLAWGRAGGSFPDATYLWWELRPQPRFGTIEVRIPDCQTSPDDVAAIAAVAQSLVAWLAERYDAGEELPVHHSFRIGENAWSALRWGLGGWLLDLETGEPAPTRERLVRLLDDLEPTAARVGCAPELAFARTLVAGNGADRQRYVAAREGLDGLLRWLVAETDPAARRRPLAA